VTAQCMPENIRCVNFSHWSS